MSTSETCSSIFSVNGPLTRNSVPLIPVGLIRDGSESAALVANCKGARSNAKAMLRNNTEKVLVDIRALCIAFMVAAIKGFDVGIDMNFKILELQLQRFLEGGDCIVRLVD